MNIIGVITSDVIGSTAIPLEKRALLLTSIRETMEEIGSVMPIKYEIYRGDSIQILSQMPEKSLSLGMLLRCGLKGRTPADSNELWDARVSIGIGTADFMSDGVAVSDGEAFRLSGRGLDSLNKGNMCINTRWDEINDEFSISTPLIDDIITGWSSIQAKATFISLLHAKTRKEIAAELGKTPQNISKILIAAREPLVRNYLTRFSTLIVHKIN